MRSILIGVNRSASSASQQKRGQTVLVCLSISVFYFWPARDKLEAGAWVLVRMWQDLNAFHRIHQANQWVDQVVQAPLSTDMPFNCEIRTKYPTTGNWPTTIWLTGFGFDSLSPSPTNNATTQEAQKSTHQPHPTSSNHIQLKLQSKNHQAPSIFQSPGVRLTKVRELLWRVWKWYRGIRENSFSARVGWFDWNSVKTEPAPKPLFWI